MNTFVNCLLYCVATSSQELTLTSLLNIPSLTFLTVELVYLLIDILFLANLAASTKSSAFIIVFLASFLIPASKGSSIFFKAALPTVAVPPVNTISAIVTGSEITSSKISVIKLPVS